MFLRIPWHCTVGNYWVYVDVWMLLCIPWHCTFREFVDIFMWTFRCCSAFLDTSDSASITITHYIGGICWCKQKNKQIFAVTELLSEPKIADPRTACSLCIDKSVLFLVLFMGLALTKFYCQARVRSPKVQSPKVKIKRTWADTIIT